jgi:SWI/SNF-related matrix-associated actin-dependent regulator 1 of chromatin subfamily A
MIQLPPMFPFQEEGLKLLQENPRFGLFWSMGLGKSRVTIADRLTLQANYPTLWVCPAKVRHTIADEFALWAPELQTSVVDEDWDGVVAPITITSYENIGKVCPELEEDPQARIKFPWRYIVLDESQYLKNWKAKRTQQVRSLARGASHLRLLSGTPAANEPIDLYTQLDILNPWKWGKYGDFAKYFCNVEGNEYSEVAKVWGNNPEHLEEFKARLKRVCQRVVKSEVAHLLPPAPRIEAEYIRPTARKNLTLAEALDGIQLKAGPKKVEACCQLITDHLEDEHFAVFTHLNETVERLRITFAERFPQHALFVVPDAGRDRVLKAAEAHTGPKILISTYHKVAEGVNTLTWPKLVIVAELDYQAAIMEQLFGRFYRLNSKHGVLIKLVVMEGTVEESVSRVLLRKLQSGAELLGASTEAGAAIEGLQGDLEDELLRLRAATKNKREVANMGDA